MAPKLVHMPSPNHDARAGALVDILVLHYTGMKTAAEALARLCDPKAKVSAHYTVDEDGRVYVHVPEDARAWHAGVSHWAGAPDVNTRSIGIEIVNPGHEFGYREFAAPQIAALIDLAQGILERHAIPAHRVLGHSDVAPARKLDPGELFPWKHLAEFGVGLWPAVKERLSAPFDEALRFFGYGFEPEADVSFEKAVEAFQRHFRPARIDGRADAECEAILAALLAQAETP